MTLSPGREVSPSPLQGQFGAQRRSRCKPSARTEVRASKCRAELAPGFAQRVPRDCCVVGDAHKRRKLGGMADERGENGKNIGTPILAQTRLRRGRKRLIERIYDDTTDSKWNASLGGDARCDVGFHVCDHRTRARMQSPLLSRVDQECVCARKIAANRRWKRSEQATYPGCICWKIAPTRPYSRANYAISGDELRVKARGHTKAYDSRSTATERHRQRTNQLRRVVADDFDAWPSGNTSLQRKARNCNNRGVPQIDFRPRTLTYLTALQPCKVAGKCHISQGELCDYQMRGRPASFQRLWPPQHIATVYRCKCNPRNVQ
jgi:hypothetical protein